MEKKKQDESRFLEALFVRMLRRRSVSLKTNNFTIRTDPHISLPFALYTVTFELKTMKKAILACYRGSPKSTVSTKISHVRIFKDLS